MDVFFYEAFAEEAEALRRHLGDGLTFEMSSATVQALGHPAPPARLISIRTQSIVPTSWAGALDGILSRSTGYDHLRAFRERSGSSLPCGYLDEYATRAVAEHAIILVASLLRRMPAQVRQMTTFDRDGLTGSEFGGKRLLVVGVGRIGIEIVRLAAGMGLHVRGVDIVQRHADVQYVAPAEGIAWADAVVCAMNLTPENAGYFSSELLSRASAGVVFVNIARGEHAPTAVLIDGLRRGKLGGVGLDVFQDEPNVAEALRHGGSTSPEAEALRTLQTLPNVILTPHNAFNTREAVERKSEMSARQVRHFLKHRRFLWGL